MDFRVITMRKLKYFLPLLFVFVFVFLQGCQAEMQGKYCNDGRDTRAQFGKDCRYAILAGYMDEEIGHYTNLISDLYDQQKDESIVQPIYSFKETDKYVYMVGKKEYLMFIKENDSLLRNVQFKSLSKKEQDIYMELEEEKSETIRKAKQEHYRNP
jgi:hypothetical protein